MRERPAGTINPNLPSGEVEVLATKLTVLAKAKTPPFHHDEPVSEELRLRYRYLDLRRAEVMRNLRLRHAVTRALRKFMDDHGFVDVETPMLAKTTPEGARDYLVPSRTQPGNFFALPQSPQLMKQLLMMAGLDRYYQIVKCFRDEDLRADRQPEFTQLDIETSFMSEEDIMELMEELLRDMFKSVLGVELPVPFPRMTYADAMRRYGSDKPDLRNPLELVEVADLFRGVEFKVFAGPAADPESRIAALGCRRAASSRAKRSTTTRRSSRATARRGSRTSRSTRGPRAATDCSRRSEVPAGCGGRRRARRARVPSTATSCSSARTKRTSSTSR